MRTGAGSYKLIAVIFLIAYWSLYSGLWFACAHQYVTNVAKKNIPHQLAVWVVGAFIYFMWLAYGIWWVFGRVEGDLFSFPLIPLARWPICLMALGTFPKSVLLIGVLLINYCMTLCMVTKRIKYLYIAFLLFLPFLIGILMGKKVEHAPALIPTLAWVSPRGIVMNHPVDVAQEITYRLMEIIREFPETETIIMPESSYNFSLNEYPEVLQMWDAHALHGRTLIIGGHRSEKNSLCNTAFVIKMSDIKYYYDKKKLAPFTEKVPAPWNAVSSLRQLFLKNEQHFSEGQQQVLFSLNDSLICQPIICSEFFIGNEKKCDACNAYIVILNDSIFASDRMQWLLKLIAIFKAIEHSMPIIYIGHYEGLWITSFGNIYALKQMHKQAE